MEKGVSFATIARFFASIWKIVLLSIILGVVLGGAIFKINGESANYKAVSSLFIVRNFSEDKNGNGFYDQDTGKFWGNFLSFTEYPWEVKKLKKQFPGYEKNNLEIKYPNFSNVLEISYIDTDKKTAIGVVNTLTNDVLENSKKYLSDKATISVINKADSSSTIKESTTSFKGNILMGLIYGAIVGFIVGSVQYIYKERKNHQ